MFHSEFYPTPPHVIQMMQIDCTDKVILEPHAGKGDLIDDNKLGAQTPYDFIKQCEDRGYKGQYQSKLEFEFN